MRLLTTLTDANLNTSYETLARPHRLEVGYSDYVTRLMTVIEHATHARNHKDLLMHHLMDFETLIRFEIPMSLRPELFRKLNNLLSHMSLTVTDDHKLCLVFLNLVNIIKSQIDAKEQVLNTSNEAEWEELQRSVFLLTEWENTLIS